MTYFLHSMWMSRYSFLRTIKSWLALQLRFDWLYGERSFSQEGEDMVLRKIFAGKQNGFYVDVGAHHPYRYSNTQWLHRQGWRGVNIDATPESMHAFTRARPHDSNWEVCIGETKGKQKYYIFSDSALNTTSLVQAQGVIVGKQSSLLQVKTVVTLPLATVLHRSVSQETHIDLLNIDVEGHELAVLQSNDWKHFIPRVIVVELLGAYTLAAVAGHQVSLFLATKNYQAIAKTGNSVIFISI